MLHPAGQQPMNSFHLSDGIRNTIPPHGSWEPTNSGFWALKPTESFRSCRSWSDMELQSGSESKQVDESGICSPPLWATSTPSSPQRGINFYQNLSPASRTQAIARGQRELMEMVRNMPESSYELSLKDLVERPRVEVPKENTVEKRNVNSQNVYRREASGRKVDRTALVKRSGNIYSGGFYLKMVFPTSLGCKKKKKKNESSTSPSVSDGSVKGVDKEWWKKSPSASVESDSGATSITSGSTKSSGSSSSSSCSRSNSRRERSVGGCWLFIGKPKSLTQE